MEISHLTYSSDGRLPLFADDDARRKALRRLTRIAGRVLVLFYLVDDHLHAVLEATRRRVGRIAQSLHLALAPVTTAPLEPARIRAVQTRSHLKWLVRYVLRQGPHHGMDHHPALWSGSCFQDLVGARHLDGLTLQTKRVLPRLRLRDVYEIVGLPTTPLEPVTDDAVSRLGLGRLISAAASAAAVHPSLRGKSPDVVRARAAVVQLAAQADFATGRLAATLDLHPHTIRRLLRRAVPDELASAIRMRLALEEVVAARILKAAGQEGNA